MQLSLITIGKGRVTYLNEGAKDYTRRIARYATLTQLEIKEERASKGLLPRDIIAREGERILQAVPSNTYLIALASGGESCSSERLAERLSDLMLRGNSKVTFIIGGAFGLSEKITGLADLQLSLSAMTFSHELARVILLEQIYRAFTIIRGESYHK